MENEINLNITIDENKKMIYIYEESSSGCKYTYNNVNDISNKIKHYLKCYHRIK